MKYTVTFSCGHTCEVQLFGAHSERERKIAWYEEHGVCPNCNKALYEEARKTLANELNLPILEGSEKQVAWAEEIRGDFILSRKKDVIAYANGTQEQRESLKKALSEAPQNLYVRLLKKIVAAFEEKSAKWWIENRD